MEEITQASRKRLCLTRQEQPGSQNRDIAMLGFAFRAGEGIIGARHALSLQISSLQIPLKIILHPVETPNLGVSTIKTFVPFVIISVILHSHETLKTRHALSLQIS